MPAPSRCRGGSLVEMLAVVAIASALLGAGATAMTNVGRTMQMSAATYRLLAGLYMARSEAIKRNARVVLCKSADGETCTGSGGWEQGWIVFHDVNNSATREAGEALIRRGERTDAHFRVSGNELVSRYVSFSPYGGTRLTTGAFQAGTITICRESLEPGEARLLVINAIGRPRIQKASVPSCV